jgi:hypothetical protein
MTSGLSTFEVEMAFGRRPLSRRAWVIVLLGVLVTAGFVIGMASIDTHLEHISRVPLKPLPSLWPEGSYARPTTYELRGTDGIYQAYASPQVWRSDEGGRTIQLADGVQIWDTRGPGFYWSIPFDTSVASGIATAPALQDGRPIVASAQLMGWTIISRLGATTPERLMGEIEAARNTGGRWSLRDGTFLGRAAQILDVSVKKGPEWQDSAGPYHKTIVIDRQYLFILASSLDAPWSASTSVEATEVRFNEPIADSVFEFVPPAGYQQCLPPQFANRGPDC